ncbi:MAG: hypothetical protein ACPGEG_05785 [Salibacteraceae bacterium]
MKYLIGTVFFIVISFLGHSQMETYSVKVNMDDGFESMDGAFALVKVNGKQIKRIAASSSGKLDFDLEFGRDYVVEFHKQYYAAKKIEVFLANVTSEMIDIGCRGNTWHVGMVQKVDGIDYSVLDDPVGKIFFEPEEKCFGWDAEYSLKVMAKLDELEREMEEKKAEFEKALTIGDKAATKKDFETAKSSLTVAKSHFPEDSRVKTLERKIEQGEESLKNEEAAAAAAVEAEKLAAAEKEIQDKYDGFIEAGDKALKSEDFETAKSNYEEAGKVKPDATAHKTKIQVVEATKTKRLAEEQAAKLAEEEALKKEEEQKALELKEKETAAAVAAAAAIEVEKEKEAALAKKAEEKAAAEAEKAAAKEKAIADKKEADRVKAEEKAIAEAAEQKEKERIEAEKAAALAAATNEKERAAAEKAAADQLAKQEEEKQKAAKAESEALEKERLEKAKQAKALADAEAEKIEQEQKVAKEAEEKAKEAKAQKELAVKEEAKRKQEQEKKVETKPVAKEKSEPVKKEEPKQVSKPKVVPKAKVKTSAVVGSVAHDNKKKKQELHTTSKKVKTSNSHADKLAKLDAAAMAQNPKSTSFHEHHDWNMNEPEVFKKIALEYPEGVTEETYMKGNKKITERVVVKDGKGQIYSKIVHPWGGVYYFKNSSVSISAIEFDLFTTLKDEDGIVIPPYHIDRVQDHDH